MMDRCRGRRTRPAGAVPASSLPASASRPMSVMVGRGDDGHQSAQVMPEGARIIGPACPEGAGMSWMGRPGRDDRVLECDGEGKRGCVSYGIHPVGCFWF